MMSETGVWVTFVRCAWFMQNWAGVVATAKEQGVLPSFLTPLERQIPMVSTADIGRVCAEAMLEDWTGKRIKELRGEDVSPNDVAAAFATAIRRDVQAVETPRSDWKNNKIAVQFTKKR
ncbi:MAG: NmrA family NAD(P)-binding protein [Tolypothrix carrinoi HA7290-LM1]|jgi:uncharacterized protein YbjT (DUF2867 family)|nr:NmrA family NAD(P)-binding protein [Tolypothrix carrinoi HA7290-LM1]